MEKINKEELMQKLELTDEELDKVAGGFHDRYSCRMELCVPIMSDTVAFRNCLELCERTFSE